MRNITSVGSLFCRFSLPVLWSNSPVVCLHSAAKRASSSRWLACCSHATTNLRHYAMPRLSPGRIIGPNQGRIIASASSLPYRIARPHHWFLVFLGVALSFLSLNSSPVQCHFTNHPVNSPNLSQLKQPPLHLQSLLGPIQPAHYFSEPLGTSGK